MDQDPVINVVQDTTFLLQRISESRSQNILAKFKPSKFCYFLIECEAYSKGLTPSFFKTVYPDTKFFWDEIFTFVRKDEIVSTGSVLVVKKKKKATYLTGGTVRIRDPKGKEHWVNCTTLDYKSFAAFMTLGRNSVAEFPPPPEGCKNNHKKQATKAIIPSPKCISPMSNLLDIPPKEVELESDEIPSHFIPKKLIPVDLSIASLIIEKISLVRQCKVAMVYLDCLYRRDVIFEQIEEALDGIFGPVTEESLFIRSDTSHMGSGSSSPNGSCFIICKIGRDLDDEVIKRKAAERRINFGEFKVQTIARAIIDGKILMFTKGMLKLGVKFDEIFGFDPSKLPKLTHDGRSILTRSSKTPFGQLGNVPLLNGFILPTILTKAVLMETKTTQPDADETKNVSTTTSVDKGSSESTESSVASTVTSAKLEAEVAVEPIIQKPCSKVTESTAKSIKSTLVGSKSEILSKLSKLEQDLLKKCIAEEQRNEFVGERLEKAHKQGNVVISIRKTPPEWSVCELKQLFGLKKLENERVLAMYTHKKTGRALNNLKLILNNPADTQKILSFNKTLVAGRKLKIERSDFKEYEIWLKYNWKDIKTLDR